MTRVLVVIVSLYHVAPKALSIDRDYDKKSHQPDIRTGADSDDWRKRQQDMLFCCYNIYVCLDFA